MEIRFGDGTKVLTPQLKLSDLLSGEPFRKLNCSHGTLYIRCHGIELETGVGTLLQPSGKGNHVLVCSLGNGTLSWKDPATPVQRAKYDFQVTAWEDR